MSKFDEIFDSFFKPSIRIIEMEEGPDGDVDFRKAHLRINDRNLFSKDEKPSVDFLNDILQSLVELKNDTKIKNQPFNIYIEFQIDKKNDNNITPSGLRITKSRFYFFNISIRIGLFISTNLLRWLLKNKDKENIELKTITNSKSAKTHISYGLLIPFPRLIELDNLYDEYLKSRNNKKTLKRIAELNKKN